jgi:hypothetical protein
MPRPPGVTAAVGLFNTTRIDMKHCSRLALFAATTVLGATCFSALADDQQSVQSQCSHKTNKTYGFQCQGFATLDPNVGLEPITQVGTVSGSATGVFEGRGTVSGSIGSVKQHLQGQAVFQDRTCFGHIQYKVWLVVPNGEIPLPPLDIDFAVVAGGDEILGAPNNFGGIGAAVPRISCRLVNVKP